MPVARSERYWKRRIKRAFSDTIGPLGWNWQTFFIGTETIFATIFWIWVLAGYEAMTQKLQLFVATAMALSLVFIVNFVWNYVMAPSRIQREAESKIEKLQGTLDKIKDKQDTVDQLSDLLSEGIHEIWNRSVQNDDELSELGKYWDDWQMRVISVLKQNFSKADQDHFARLGVVPLRGKSEMYNRSHAKILREYALKEERLREIIRDHNVTTIKISE